MRRAFLAAAAVLFLLVGSVQADTFGGIHWSLAQTPPTHVDLYDETSDPRLSQLVREVAQTWTDLTPALILDYHHVEPGCRARRNQLWVCGEDVPGGVASWADINIASGRNNTTIRSVVVYLNTANHFDAAHLADPVWAPVHRYLICHEMGGGLGLAERSWPVEFNPDGTLNEYHHGCMNLNWSTPYPSQNDYDTLMFLYAGVPMP
jgi:hypothetical protein